MSSCVQLYKANLTCTDAPTAPCCTTADKYVWANVWSLSLPNGQDNLVTNNRAERQALLAEGWVENCSPIVGPTDFCVNTDEPDGRNGPFMLFNASLPNTVPIYRCITTSTTHFISGSSSCEGRGKMEFLVGYASATPNNDTVRAIRRCRNSAGTAFFHALDLQCDINDSLILGYVH